MQFTYLYAVAFVCCAVGMLEAVPRSDSGGAGSEYDGVVLPADQADESLKSKGDITIRVDEHRPIKAFSSDIFGFNYDWDLTQALVLPSGATEPDPNVARKLAGVSLPLNRVAGSDSKRFRWKDAIGDLAARPPQKLWDWSKGVPVLFGPVEWISWVQQTAPGARFSWVVNLNESPSDIRDLAQFLCGTAGPPSDEGEENDWAGRRVELGISDPVNVAIWEIGNEMDLGDESRRWSVQRYIETADLAIDAIRGVDSDAVIAVHATSSPWAPPRPGRQPWRNWHRQVLRALGDKVDMLVFHPYYNGIPLSEVEGYMNVMSEDIVDITGSDRIKLYLSEHAVWPQMPPDGNWKRNWYQTHSLGGTLNTALFITMCINRTDTAAAAYHSFHSGPWGLIYRDGETGALYTTGIAAMFELWGEIDGTQVLPAQILVDGLEIPHQELRSRLGVTAIRADNGLQVAVVNRTGTATKFFFETELEYEISGVKILSGSDLNLSNTVNESPLSVQAVAWPKSEGFPQITLPAWSFSIVNLSPKIKE